MKWLSSSCPSKRHCLPGLEKGATQCEEQADFGEGLGLVCATGSARHCMTVAALRQATRCPRSIASCTTASARRSTARWCACATARSARTASRPSATARASSAPAATATSRTSPSPHRFRCRVLNLARARASPCRPRVSCWRAKRRVGYRDLEAWAWLIGVQACPAGYGEAAQAGPLQWHTVHRLLDFP